MLVRYIMTTPVITATPDTPVLEAAKIMKDKAIERIPVVDKKGQLVGIVTKDRLLRTAPSDATSLSLHEMHYLYAKLTLGEIMRKDPCSVTPDTTLEGAVRVAQENRVGCLPVVENDEVVGILTTNDFFYLVLNPILGIGQAGSRVIVRHCENTRTLRDAVDCVLEVGCNLSNMAYLPSRRGNENDLLIHIDEEDNSRLVECMKEKGLEVESRKR